MRPGLVHASALCVLLHKPTWHGGVLNERLDVLIAALAAAMRMPALAVVALRRPRLCSTWREASGLGSVLAA